MTKCKAKFNVDLNIFSSFSAFFIFIYFVSSASSSSSSWSRLRMHGMAPLYLCKQVPGRCPQNPYLKGWVFEKRTSALHPVQPESNEPPGKTKMIWFFFFVSSCCTCLCFFQITCSLRQIMTRVAHGTFRHWDWNKSLITGMQRMTTFRSVRKISTLPNQLASCVLMCVTGICSHKDVQGAVWALRHIIITKNIQKNSHFKSTSDL